MNGGLRAGCKLLRTENELWKVTQTSKCSGPNHGSPLLGREHASKKSREKRKMKKKNSKDENARMEIVTLSARTSLPLSATQSAASDRVSEGEKSSCFFNAPMNPLLCRNLVVRLTAWWLVVRLTADCHCWLAAA